MDTSNVIIGWKNCAAFLEIGLDGLMQRQVRKTLPFGFSKIGGTIVFDKNELERVKAEIAAGRLFKKAVNYRKELK